MRLARCLFSHYKDIHTFEKAREILKEKEWGKVMSLIFNREN